MGFKYRPMKVRDVCRGLKNLGFKPRKQKATSHQHWIKDVEVNGKNYRYKVTVSTHLAPFQQQLMKSMIKQSGVSKHEFYIACGFTC